MFEKEAEELFKKKPLGYEMKPEIEIYKDGFKDGYNKAKEEMQEQGLALQSDMDKTIEQNIQLKKELNKSNEWHYVKSGDLPAEDTRVLALMAGGEVCIAHFYRKNVWDKIGTVYAWKEIELPEEIKENDI